jgi:hypothetical protein
VREGGGFNLFILTQLLVFYKFIMNKVNCGIANKIGLFTVLSVFLAMVITPPLLSPTIHGAAVGLKINVHVDGAGKVCAFSAVENLGCKTSIGQGVVNFQFSEGGVAMGDKFTACFENNCVEKVNGPKNAPEDVFIPGSKTIFNLGNNTDGGDGGYGNGVQAETQQPKKNYNPSPANFKDRIPLFCDEVNQGNYKAAVEIAGLLGLEPIDVALRGGCMGFGLGEYLSLNNTR